MLDGILSSKPNRPTFRRLRRKRPDISSTPPLAHRLGYADTELTTHPESNREHPPGFKPPACLGRYRVRELIGAGAMGNVYSAEHVNLGQRVAIKALRPELCGHSTFVQRMLAEARVSARVCDPHLVRVLDLACEESGLTWFAMELLEGESVSSLCGNVDVRRALEIVIQVCDALVSVHDAGIAHLDIKPSNLFVVKRGNSDFVKMLDFGIARLPELDASGEAAPHDVALGTPPYMAPEQAAGGPADHRADIYAIGAVLFELLTGRLLFVRDRVDELLAAVLVAEPPIPSHECSLPLSVRGAIDRVVSWCLKKDPNARPQSASELLRELRAIARRLDASSKPASSKPAPATTARPRAIAPGHPTESDATADTYRLPPAAVRASRAARSPRAWAFGLVVAAAAWLMPSLPVSDVRPALFRHPLSQWIAAQTESAFGVERVSAQKAWALRRAKR